jgi:O-acetylserine/cysteine efflux transporter
MTRAPALSLRDYLCVLGIVVIWGLNFVIMKIGLQTFSPMMLGALRFGLASLPFLPFIRRPSVPWRYVVAYGLSLGIGQFGLLFTAIHLGMPAGMASLVIQTQAFFTLILAVLVQREATRPYHWLGLALSAIGLAVIATAGGSGPAAMTLIGFVLTLGAAFMWAVSNLIVRRASQVAPGYNPYRFVTWSSAVSVLPFLAAAYVEGGTEALAQAVHMGWPALLSVLYLALLATVLGYGLWTQLLMRHPAAKVAPFSLLVPVIGLVAAAWVFDEHLMRQQWLGAFVVLAGLVVNQLGAAWRAKK